jgi:hypothetical protein
MFQHDELSFLDLLEDERWRIFLPVTLTVDIPDDLAADQGAGFQNLGCAALEALLRKRIPKKYSHWSRSGECWA